MFLLDLSVCFQLYKWSPRANMRITYVLVAKYSSHCAQNTHTHTHKWHSWGTSFTSVRINNISYEFTLQTFPHNISSCNWFIRWPSSIFWLAFVHTTPWFWCHSLHCNFKFVHIEVNTSHLMMMMTMMIIIFQNHQSRQHIHCVHIQLIRSHTIASILPPKQFECQCQCIVTKLRQCNNSGCLESCKKNRSPKIMEINDPEKCWRCRSDWRCNTTRLCVCAWFSVSYYHHLTVFVFSQHIFRLMCWWFCLYV